MMVGQALTTRRNVRENQRAKQEHALRIASTHYIRKFAPRMGNTPARPKVQDLRAKKNAWHLRLRGVNFAAHPSLRTGFALAHCPSEIMGATKHARCVFAKHKRPKEL